MQNKHSRSYNLIFNVATSGITQIVIMLISFANRTVFIHLLGQEYLGVDGLFTSILTAFSLAELGLGSAIIYNLYKPIATDDIEKARQYISFYKKSYLVISSVIGLVAIGLMPFLKQIVRADKLQIDINIYAVFAIFIINTLSSYFLAHYQAILVVNQKQRTVSLIQTLVRGGALLIEIFVLWFFHSYYLYLIIKVLGNYLQAFAIYICSKKQFPELCKKSGSKLNKDEIKGISKNVGALFLRRTGSVATSSADNVIINTYINTAMVGIYSNYTLIISSFNSITTHFFSAMTASIGNFVAVKQEKQVNLLFKLYSYVVYLVYGFCGICIFTLSNRFIKILWGDSYIVPQLTVFVFVVNFFLHGFQAAINTFRDTTGLFVQGKFRYLFTALVNIILSIILVKPLGLTGIILATVIARLLVAVWYDPYVLYKNLFRKSPAKYYVKLAEYGLVFCAICFLVNFICGKIETTVLGSVMCLFISMPLCLLLLVVPFLFTKENRQLIKFVKNIIFKIFKKSQHKKCEML